MAKKRTQNLNYSIRNGDVEGVRKKLNRGADPTASYEVDITSKNYLESTPLHLAAGSHKPNAMECLDEMLKVCSKDDINAKDSFGRTLLHIAAFNGNIDIVGYLIHRGADTQLVDHEGNTVLHSAAAGKHKNSRDVFEILHEKNPELVLCNNKDGYFPDGWAQRKGHAENSAFLRTIREQTTVGAHVQTAAAIPRSMPCTQEIQDLQNNGSPQGFISNLERTRGIHHTAPATTHDPVNLPGLRDFTARLEASSASCTTWGGYSQS